MNTMTPTRPTELDACRVRLTTGPGAAAEARSKVRAVIGAWQIPVDPDLAVLLASDLVTNAIRREAGGAVTLTVRCARGQLRVDVHGTSRPRPARADAPADAEIRQGLILVATLSDEWGCYRTPAGEAVYFTLASRPDLAGGGRRDLE